jgi:proteasome lid subunit RPN8/RPN11
MIDDIQNHFKEVYPLEACGIVGVVKGKKKYFPCENIADSGDEFVLSSTDYFRIKQQADVLAIVHSHPDAECSPSPHDIVSCNALGIPYYIFSYPGMDLHIQEPIKNFNPLIGREYEFGKYDCFEAMRDWLASKGIDIAPRAPFENDWWDKGLNYFTEEIIANWGFKKVTTPQENDLLVFQVAHDIPDHCGVYLGDDIFFHHVPNRLSCRDSLLPLWHKKIVGIYRYDA